MTAKPQVGNTTNRGKRDVPEPEGAVISASGLATKVKDAVGTGGDIVRFSTKVVRSLPDTRHYTSDIFHQAAILIVSSGLVIWFMLFVVGSMCGLESVYTMKAIGTQPYSGIFTSYCGLREMGPYMWAYILAAKVGCGLVAEIGSMRISEEIDAMEVMGVDSKSYLVGTRVLAAWIAMPFLFIVGLGLMYMSMYLVAVVQLGGVSSGGYWYVFWLYQNPADLTYAMSKAIIMGTAIILIGCYYGYYARGGPVGVGQNTAKSMMLNMVVVHIIATLLTQLFWGFSPNAPIGN